MGKTVYYTCDYYTPYINCCLANSNYGSVDGYKEYLENCFKTLSDCYNNASDNYKGQWAGMAYNNVSKKCADAWTQEYANMICPILSSTQANADAASTAEESAINDAIQSRQTAINAGMGKSRAGLLGDAASNTNTTCAYQNAYQSSIQNQGSTQADYLNKMGQACALCNCANNMQKGALLNSIGAAFTGAGSGASLGASLASGK